MNLKAWRVVEAVRNLRMSISMTDKGESVKINGSASHFPEKLLQLQKTLEDLDKDGGFTIHESTKSLALERENELLRDGIDNVFRWMRQNDIDVSDPYAILEECLKIPKSKRAKNLTLSPSFAKKVKNKTAAIPKKKARSKQQDTDLNKQQETKGVDNNQSLHPSKLS